MMQQNIGFFLALITTLILASCSSPKVAFDYDETVNFSQYQTYNIYPIQDSLMSDLDKNRILTTLNDSLQRYGLQKKLIPDFNVNVFAEAYQRTSTNYVGVGIGSFGGLVGGGVNGNIPLNSTKTKYAITIEFIDGLTKSLFWQAVVEISQHKLEDPEERTEMLRTLIGLALQKYPGFYPDLVED